MLLAACLAGTKAATEAIRVAMTADFILTYFNVGIVSRRMLFVMLFQDFWPQSLSPRFNFALRKDRITYHGDGGHPALRIANL